MTTDKKFTIEERKIYSNGDVEPHGSLLCERCGTSRPYTKFQINHLTDGKFKRRDKCKVCPDMSVPKQKREKHTYKQLMSKITDLEGQITGLLTTCESNTHSIKSLRLKRESVESSGEAPEQSSGTHSLDSDES